jgi:uncharacterized RDD family membrane protein YckC
LSNAPSPLDPFAPPVAELDPRPTLGDDLPLAARGSRLSAALLDSLMMVPLLLVGCVVAYLVFGDDLANDKSSTGNTIAAGVLIGACMLPLLAYQWYLTATTGQTISKKILKIIFSADRRTLHDRIAGTKVVSLQ